MKLSITKLIIPAATLPLLFSSCKNDEETDTTDYALDYDSSTLVSSFNIKSNDNILENLDSVFFSIDQVKAEIFNADSLPWGTDVRKLVVNVTTQLSASISITMPSLEDGNNVTVTTSDSINFTSAQGVWMSVTSYNGEHERIYSVKVNVHQCNPDSLQWSTETFTLPSAGMPGLKESQTVELNGKVYTLARGTSDTKIYVSDSPAATESDITVVDLPADADINSLCASSDALYLLTASGSLLTSANGVDWTEAATGWTHLYGAYADQVIGLKENKWHSYPSGRSGDLPEGMPVSETSRMWTFTNDWAIAPMALFVGGRDASGALSSNAWGFDGANWMQLSGLMQTRMLPAAANMTLFPYFTFKVNTTTYLVNKQSAWFALGGTLADGTINDRVYVSLDNGVNWSEAPDDLQLPAEVAPRCSASVLLSDHTFTASRAISPITEWDAPYVYMFGGYDASGKLLREVRVGVINRLTFKPLQ